MNLAISSNTHYGKNGCKEQSEYLQQTHPEEEKTVIITFTSVLLSQKLEQPIRTNNNRVNYETRGQSIRLPFVLNTQDMLEVR